MALFASDGLVMDLACTGTGGVHVARAAPPDLVELSLSLVDEDPLAIVAALRAADAPPPLLVIAPEDRNALLRAFDLGADDWVGLPLDRDQLRARARNQIRRKLYQDRLRADLGAALDLASSDPLTGLRNQRW